MKPVFIIAEAGVNHNGNFDLALKMVEVAKECGADAIKFQTFQAESLVDTHAQLADYQKNNLKNKTISQYEMLKALELSKDNFIKLKKKSDQVGIYFLSTPFDEESVGFLEPLVNAFKISSGDLTHYPLLKRVSQGDKPVILSTGMSDLEEVRRACQVFYGHKCKSDILNPLTLLHCTTNYPASFAEVNLLAMKTLNQELKLSVGYSDHTVGCEVALAAVAMGASMIEKHFTLDSSMEGPDHKASLDPLALKQFIKIIREIELALGDGIKKPMNSELSNRKIARRSLYYSKKIDAGSKISEKDLIVKRPAIGLNPFDWDSIVGKTLKKSVNKDALVEKEDFAED
ncbi:MAG: N-acetylneuraminate synthase [Deltaproteobacteria bacterium RIFCSPLOWO2_12_FULL_40_28]|nr:MAG: N-acetylneuraminate synthase [Deltaproteobacteria bacterium RIFCSPHIGHO2_02_FULL_40_28]OGQ19587.1 MAG: N-acetylneuraminate synthase [Deltaproteobacteria bacterium RIFCSPHIGHO2_12_FULL_40_32]OGQ40864.1 MAG: N-acetylneuraminate synthase [Deltaproteobacteria bacterium RIFCSPLOWO2_02_FULL_40_36]OGQ53979.1 MAG: N-acetylneuraminate synthase [Deltaproteobacteria bacterium RIFCSPLOWO2_12_FULL_40_28]